MTEASRRDFLILTGAAGAGLLLLAEGPPAGRHRCPPILPPSLDAATGRTKVAAMLADAPTSGGSSVRAAADLPAATTFRS